MNVLVTRHDKIGDFMTTLPMLKILKKNTKHKVIVLVSKINYDLAKSLDYVDDVILYTKNTTELLGEIRSRRIDVSISCFIDTHLAWVLFLARIRERFGPATKLAQIFLNRRVKQRRSEVKMTEWQYNVELLKAFVPDIKTDIDRPLLPFSKEKVEDKKIVAFHAGFGGSSDGNLTLDDYINLARSIKDKENLKIVFTFGPDDGESKKYIEEKIDFKVDIIDSKMSLVEFCEMISTFDLFVSTSTGPMHLAGGLNIKTMSFFGDSLFASSKRWATISDKDKQNNFEVPKNYGREFYSKVENKLKELVDEVQ